MELWGLFKIPFSAGAIPKGCFLWLGEGLGLCEEEVVRSLFPGRQCVFRGSFGGRRGAHSFFRRLYMSLLLRSPAQVRLLRRNFLRSSLKSSWCIGR